MPARIMAHMMRGAMRMRRAVDRMVMVPVRTRLCVGVRKGDYASGYEKRSDEFLLHHHS